MAYSKFFYFSALYYADFNLTEDDFDFVKRSEFYSINYFPPFI